VPRVINLLASSEKTRAVEKGAAGKVLFSFGPAATIVVTLFVTGVARKALRQGVPRSAEAKTQKENPNSVA